MKKWILLTCTVCMFLLFPSSTFAATYTDKICVDGNQYTLTSYGSKVDIDKVTSEQISNGSTLSADYFADKKNMGTAEFKAKYGEIKESDYEIKASPVQLGCTVVGNGGARKWQSCPTSAQTEKIFSTSNVESSIGNFKFNGSGGFELFIEDKFDSKMLVRIVRNGIRNRPTDPNEIPYPYNVAVEKGKIGAGETYNLGPDGLRFTFSRDEEVILEFYIRPDSGIDCSGAFVADMVLPVPSFAMVKNPALDYAACKSFKSDSYTKVPKDYKSVLVNECYDKEVDYFTDLPKITEAAVSQKIAELEGIFSIAPSGNDISNLQCHYRPDGVHERATETKTYIWNPGGYKYWAASCEETAEIVYDQPKKLIAGAGFSYETSLQVTRKCTPFVLKKITPPSLCKYGIECWGGPLKHTGEGGAGPNEEFDSCVTNCDGGIYSRNCVNSCYESVYGKKTNSLGLNTQNSNSFLDTIQARQIAVPEGQMACGWNHRCNLNSYSCCSTNKQYNAWGKSYYQLKDGKPETTKRGNVIFGLASASNENCPNYLCTSFHGLQFGYFPPCNNKNNPTLCYEVYTSQTKPTCSDYPDGEIADEIAQSESEYNNLIRLLGEYKTEETFETNITDSYKTGSDGKPLVTNAKSVDNMVKVTTNVSEPNITQGVASLVYAAKSTGESLTKSVPRVEVHKSYKIELPRAVINQLTYQEKYVQTDYNRAQDERDGGNKYYTDIHSDIYNDFTKWTNDNTYWPSDKTIPNTGNNINVIFKNIGTKQTGKDDKAYTWNSSDIDCFYGVINKMLDCDDGICDLECDPKAGEICTGELRYMFRQVNLNDMFPERDPRWNWKYTSDIDQYGYASQPSEVIEKTQTLGNSTFSSENLDYDITITKENIRMIRSYNKRLKNYLNYQSNEQNATDMVCTTKGTMEVCESKFLSSPTYVKSFQRNTEIGSND